MGRAVKHKHLKLRVTREIYSKKKVSVQWTVSQDLRIPLVLTKWEPIIFMIKNLHNYFAKTFIASLVLFSKTNPRKLFNELAFYRMRILHRMRISKHCQTLGSNKNRWALVIIETIYSKYQQQYQIEFTYNFVGMPLLKNLGK